VGSKAAKLAAVAVLAVLAALTQETLGSPCRPRRLKRFQDRQSRPPTCSRWRPWRCLAPLPLASGIERVRNHAPFAGSAGSLHRWRPPAQGHAAHGVRKPDPPFAGSAGSLHRDLAGGHRLRGALPSRIRRSVDGVDDPLSGVHKATPGPQGSTRTPLDPAAGPRRTRYRVLAAVGAAFHPSWRIRALRLANLVSV
jgi:hypothetical protein